MHYEIRLLDPTGMVAEIHPGTGDEPCAITRARILLDNHREMSGAQVRHHDDIIEVPCESAH